MLRWLRDTVIGLSMVVLLILCFYGIVVGFSYAREAREEKRTEKVYAQAMELLQEGKEHAAEELLVPLEFYKNSRILTLYAQARPLFYARYYEDRYAALEKADLIPADYDGDLAEEIHAFLEEVAAERRDIVKEYEEQERQKAQQKAREERLWKEAAALPPYVGEDEKYIQNTALGRADDTMDWFNDYDCSKTPHSHMEYRWYDHHDQLIFEATVCEVKKKVIDVLDWRKGRPASSSSESYYTSGDFYHVDEYADAEEFYYWNSDDFYDYEDAEEYFDEYG